MSEKPDHSALFDDYLLDKLSTEDKSSFEKRLEDDKGFMLDFENHKEKVSLIRILGIREEMKSILEEADVPKIKKKGISLRYIIPLAIAASITLFLVFRPTINVNNKALFEQYFELYPDAISGRDTSSEIHEAMLLYNEERHHEAIAAFEKLSTNDTINFYRSLSNLALKRPQAAIEGFNAIRDSSMFYVQSQWYKGLSFLLLKQPDSVLASFKNIKAESRYKNLSAEIVGQFK